jgi:exportin-7
MKHCSATSSSISYFCDYVIKVSQKNLPEKQAVQDRIRENDYLMVELFRHVVEVIVLEDSSYMWTLSKPLLGLIIINESHFESIKNLVMLKVTCSVENHEKLSKALNELMNGISRTLDAKNRDRFGKNFSSLRQVLGSIYG